MTGLHNALSTFAERAPRPAELTPDLAQTAWAIGRRRRVRRRRRVSVLIATVVVLAAGGSAVIRDRLVTPPPAAPPVSLGLVITPAEPWDALPDGIVNGPLSERDGCLLIAGDPVFWPHGTTWNDANKSVVFTNGRHVSLGDQFAGGGGYYSNDPTALTVLGSDEAAGRLLSCVQAVGASEVVFAYPEAADQPAVTSTSMDRVRAVADDLSLWRRAGYGKVALDFRRSLVTVYWRGPVPARITDAVGRTRGVHVKVVQVDYSEDDLTRVGRSILKASQKSGPTVYAVMPNDDYSGVVVETTREADLDAVAAWATQATGVPTTAVAGEPFNLQ